MRQTLAAWAVTGLLILAAAACGGETPATAPTRAVPTEAPPTATPAPTPTPKPTSLPLTALRSGAEAYASCRGRYSGEELESRKRKMLEDMTAGRVTPAQAIRMTLAECGGETASQQMPFIEPRTLSGNRAQAGTPETATPTPPPPAPARTAGMEEVIASRNPGGAPDLAQSLGELEWTQAGLDPTAAMIVLHLTDLHGADPETALRVAAMPFLETPEPRDLSAIMSLSYLARSAPEKVKERLDSPPLAGGVTDENALGVSLLYGAHVFGEDGSLVLGSGIGSRTRRTQLINTGAVVITLAGTGFAPTEERMNRVELALLKLDEYMGMPLPTSHILIHYDDRLPEGVEAVNLLTHVRMRATYALEGTDTAERTGRELARYWWNGNAGWLDGGMAVLTSSLAVSAAETHRNRNVTPDCPLADSLEQLAELRETGENSHPGCEEALGERLLRTLRGRTTDERFLYGARNTLRIVRELNASAGPGQAGPEELERGFEAYAPEDAQAAVDRWYRKDGAE